MRYHPSPLPLAWIKDFNYCPVCGKRMTKEEGKHRKICENGCVAFLFEKMKATA